MNQSISTSKIIVSLLMLSALALPVLLIVSIISWILIGAIRLSVKEERNAMILIFKKNRILQLLPALYLLHIIGLLWTSDFKYAGMDLQIKLTFLLLPFAIGTAKINLTDIYKILKAFIGGCILASLYLLIHAYYSYSESLDVSHFFYTGLCSPLMHPTYFTMYLNLAIIVVLSIIISAKKVSTQSISAIILYFLLLMSILSSARTAQGAIVISSILFLLFQRKKIKLVQSGLAVLITVLFMTIPTHILLTKINNRYAQVENAIASPVQTSKIDYNSTTGRLEIWKESFELLNDHWLFGTGTGDIREELVKTYKSHDFKYGYEKQLNTHNEYLQVWVSIGIIGLLLIFMIHLMPILNYRRYPDLIFPAFIMLCAINALTEATLETQRGALFFAFFFSLMAVNNKAST